MTLAKAKGAPTIVIIARCIPKERLAPYVLDIHCDTIAELKKTY